MKQPRLKPWRCLSPFAVLYRWVTGFRNKRFDSGAARAIQAAVPVISVGNITSGGSGKSPVSSFVVRRLRREGRKPVLLSRGYKGSSAAPHLVEPGDSAGVVGDEALMHCRELAGEACVVVSKDRAAGCRFIADNRLGDVVVLDDGFQHRQLKRDLDVVLIDVSSAAALQEWREGRLLPAGPFREEKDAALSRADCVLAVTRDASSSKNLGSMRTALGISGGVPVFSVELYPECFIDIHRSHRLELDELKAASVRAVSGIAKPDVFFDMVRRLGIAVDREFSFPDHHNYSEKDWDRVAAGFSGPIVTTAKDAVKLEKLADARSSVYALALDMRFICLGEERRFWNMIESVIAPETADRRSIQTA